MTVDGMTDGSDAQGIDLTHHVRMHASSGFCLHATRNMLLEADDASAALRISATYLIGLTLLRQVFMPVAEAERAVQSLRVLPIDAVRCA